MEKRPFSFLLKLLPGLLPLLVFIGVDAIWGTEAGLIVAIAFGLGELAFILIREKRFDWFVISDTGLLLLLGLVSLMSADEIFFKLKPALINGIFLVIIGLSAFSGKNILLLYSKRYLKGIEIDESKQEAVVKIYRVMFWLFFVHTALIVYSAFFMSKAAWGFISGALLYILFGLYFAWQFITQKTRMKSRKKEEWFPLVDEKGNITGKIKRKDAHRQRGSLHPVVHLHIINSRGEIYLQKRPDNKDIQPGKWDTSVGGHVALGETIEQALRREAKEELNLENFSYIPFTTYRWDSPEESELVYSFVTRVDRPVQYNPDELSDGRFWKREDIDQLFGRNIFTPNFEREYPILKDHFPVFLKQFLQ